MFYAIFRCYKILDGWKPADKFFCDYLYQGKISHPSVQVAVTEADPVLGDYVWELDIPDLIHKYLHWDQFDYIRKVTKAIGALYRYVVLEGQVSTYRCYPSYVLKAMEALLDSLIECPYPKSMSLPISPESFSAQFTVGRGLSISIGDRSIFLPSVKANPDALRHDLEHILFHEETILSLTGKINEQGSLMLRFPACRNEKRQPRPLRGKRWMTISANYFNGLDDIEIAGICDEMEVLSSLYSTLVASFSKSARSHSIEKRLSWLRFKMLANNDHHS